MEGKVKSKKCSVNIKKQSMEVDNLQNANIGILIFLMITNIKFCLFLKSNLKHMEFGIK